MDLKLRNNSQLALTDGYIPVEYIKSSGYPNIDTGVTLYGSATSKNKIELDIEINSIETSTYVYYALANSRLTYLSYSGSGNIYNVKSVAQASAANTQVEIIGRSHIIHTLPNITINDNTTTITGQAYASTSPKLYLLNNANSPITIIHNIKIYNTSGTLARDYIPVISYQEGHWGEACLYDKVNGVFYYSASTGSFTASTNIYAKMITAYIKDCPNISGIDLLRRAVNLQRIRCDVGNVSGSVAELFRYTALAGFTDDYQEQQIPRIVGTWTLNNWYTNEELENFQGAIDGLTVLGDSTHNIETALENGDFAAQTIDSTKPNYNPAVAIKLNANGYGNIFTALIIEGEGRWFLTKDEAASISDSTIFTQFTTVVDEDGIVTDNDEEEYTFDSFDEFKYFNGITTLGGAATSPAGFSGCTNLERVVIPNSITRLGGGRNNDNGAFGGCSSLERINFPSSITTSGASSTYISVFTGCTSLSRVDIDDLSSYLSVTFYGISSAPFHASTAEQRGLYLNEELLTNIVIPETITSVKDYVFHKMNTITSIILHNSITSIGNHAFYNCYGLTSINIPNSVTSIEQYAFYGCSGLTGTLIIPNSVTSIGTLAFSGLSNITLLHIPVAITSSIVNNSGKEGGTLIVDGNYTTERNYTNINFSNIIISGNFITGANRCFTNSDNLSTFRLNGNYNSSGGTNLLGSGTNATVKFIEINGSVTGAVFYLVIPVSGSQTVYHFGSSQIALTTTQFANYSATANDKVIARASKFLVGDGSSRSNDEATLALYLADSTWSAQSAKLGTWYDYNGEYKWYYITDNLTNCTNTNPDAWPHITRGESYETTIVPDEGMTIDSITVEMLDTDTTSPTYDTYIPQPTSYDSATGIYTISIPSVTGNVVITASAS